MEKYKLPLNKVKRKCGAAWELSKTVDLELNQGKKWLSAQSNQLMLITEASI